MLFIIIIIFSINDDQFAIMINVVIMIDLFTMCIIIIIIKLSSLIFLLNFSTVSRYYHYLFMFD